MWIGQIIEVILKTKQNPLLPPYVHVNYISFLIRGVRIVVHTGLEPVASRVWSERDNHYTNELIAFLWTNMKGIPSFAYGAGT